MSFVDEYCIIFGEQDDDHNLLEYTNIHNEYCRLIDNVLQNRLLELGISEHAFCEACCALGEELHNNTNKLDITHVEDSYKKCGTTTTKNNLVLAQIRMFDFIEFKSMMIKRNRDLEKEAIQALVLVDEKKNSITKRLKSNEINIKESVGELSEGMNSLGETLLPDRDTQKDNGGVTKENNIQNSNNSKIEKNDSCNFQQIIEKESDEESYPLEIPIIASVEEQEPKQFLYPPLPPVLSLISIELTDTTTNIVLDEKDEREKEHCNNQAESVKSSPILDSQNDNQQQEKLIGKLQPELDNNLLKTVDEIMVKKIQSTNNTRKNNGVGTLFLGKF